MFSFPVLAAKTINYRVKVAYGSSIFKRMKVRSPTQSKSARRSSLPPSPRVLAGIKSTSPLFSRTRTSAGRRNSMAAGDSADAKAPDRNMFRKRRRSSTGLARLKLEEREFLLSINVSVGSKKQLVNFSPQKSPLAKTSRKNAENANADRERRQSSDVVSTNGATHFDDFEKAWKLSDYLQLLSRSRDNDGVPPRCLTRHYFGIPGECPQVQFEDFCRVADFLCKTACIPLEMPSAEDAEPIVRVQSILNAARSSFPFFDSSHYPINKVSQAHGRHACALLQQFAILSLENDSRARIQKRVVDTRTLPPASAVDVDGEVWSSDESEENEEEGKEWYCEHERGACPPKLPCASEGNPSSETGTWMLERDRVSKQIGKITFGQPPRWKAIIEAGTRFLSADDATGPLQRHLGCKSAACVSAAAAVEKGERQINSMPTTSTLKAEYAFHARRLRKAQHAADVASMQAREASAHVQDLDAAIDDAALRVAARSDGATAVARVRKLRRAMKTLQADIRHIDVKIAIVQQVLLNHRS